MPHTEFEKYKRFAYELVIGLVQEILSDKSHTGLYEGFFLSFCSSNQA